MWEPGAGVTSEEKGGREDFPLGGHTQELPVFIFCGRYQNW